MGLWGKTEQAGEKKRDTRGRIRRLRSRKPWIFWGVLISLGCAFVFSSLYGLFRSYAEKYQVNPIENNNNISWLFQSCYLLYRDLYNVQHEEQLDYADVYLEADEGYEWILDEDQLSAHMEMMQLENGEWEEQWAEQWNELAACLQELFEEGYLQEEQMEYLLGLHTFLEIGGSRDGSVSSEGGIEYWECDSLREEINNLKGYFQSLEGSFRSLNSNYNYIIRDNITGKYVTNMPANEMGLNIQDQYFLLGFTFDSVGNVTVEENVCGKDESLVRKYAYEAVRENALGSLIYNNMEIFNRFGKVKKPVDCTVFFAIPQADWLSRGESYIGNSISYSDYYGNYTIYSIDGYNTVYALGNTEVGGILCLFMVCLVILGAFLPVLGGTKPWRDERICRFPFEILFCIAIAICAAGEMILAMIAFSISDRAVVEVAAYMGAGTGDFVEFMLWCFNLLALTLFFFCAWYMGVCCRALKEFGVKQYIKQRSMIYRFFPYMKGKAVRAYEAVTHLDLTKEAHWAIIKVLIANGVVLFMISCLWLGGLGITVVYSVVLYVILRKYISDLQKKYRILLKAVDEIAEGNLNVSINEDLGVFEPFRSQVFKIQDGLKKAVDVEVKSQRMKAELITNMSHDLKTPLTAIITYVNLLKEEKEEDKCREYLATLERKSLRLKSLIEDLFEFSKANSDNVTLNIMDVDIMNLVKQVSFELSDKISASGLDVRMNLTEEKVILPLDSQKTYRIYENLFGNIAKYALTGTRVYVNGFRIDDTVVITLKNISAQEITVETSELTERFVRGDASRNTEGSGLGLAIAKSFTELQGGELELEVDGDLFKVTTLWHIGVRKD